MKKVKKVTLLILTFVGLPLIYGANRLLIHFMPDEYILADGKISEEGMKWVISWSGSISIVLLFFMLALIYRFWASKKD